jgi:hypothetical protein
MAIQSLKQLTVRIDKVVNSQYLVTEYLKKDLVWHNWFVFQDLEMDITFISDSKEELFEQIENHYSNL